MNRKVTVEISGLKARGARYDKYHSQNVSTDEEATRLIETGWQFVCTNPDTKRMHFRKQK